VKVVSVNVGLPREVTWHGALVTTGIFKEPVSILPSPARVRWAPAMRSKRWLETRTPFHSPKSLGSK
jgi:hypothetical protein